jgi:DNA-binding NarL/FixJ family response regulator
MPERLIDAVRKLVAYSEEAEARDALTASARGKISGLTPREMTIARLVISGAQNKAIAEELGLAEQSVKIYRSHVCQKLEVKNAVELGELFRSRRMATSQAASS